MPKSYSLLRLFISLVTLQMFSTTAYETGEGSETNNLTSTLQQEQNLEIKRKSKNGRWKEQQMFIWGDEKATNEKLIVGDQINEIKERNWRAKRNQMKCTI